MADRAASQLTSQERSDINDRIARGLDRLAISADAAPAQIVRVADDYVEKEQIEREKFLKGIWFIFRVPAQPICDEIGAVWGGQVCRELSWTWLSVVREKEPELAVASPGHRFVIFPIWYLGQVLEAPFTDNTFMLTFNMLKEGKLSDAADGALEDLTGRVRHIVPKRLRPFYRRG